MNRLKVKPTAQCGDFDELPQACVVGKPGQAVSNHWVSTH
ncbi:UNVERIFIED_ORG: hypothetical protein BDU10_6818 [Burkholderia sp. CF145]|jgi:hypothetical protein|nr:hypothetical protein PMI06_000916 [Burkholderia sp. BT03]SKD07734.1 hypothetical protein SAMN06266956_10152 [Paraburkholderia hospita]